MTDIQPYTAPPKSFWKRPEGVTGAIFLAGILIGAIYLVLANMSAIVALASNVLYLSLMLIGLGLLLYVVLDPRMRNLIWYMYKSVMRWITGLFIQIDPIGILKSYVQDLEKNIKKLSKQIGSLRGQMRKLKTLRKKKRKRLSTTSCWRKKPKGKGRKTRCFWLPERRHGFRRVIKSMPIFRKK